MTFLPISAGQTAMFTLIAAAITLSGCSQFDASTSPDGEAEEAAAEDYERGPHNGRMLRSGDFALEMTIFEDGTPPVFQVYAYIDGEPVDPSAVQLQVALGRLDGEVNRFAFTPQQDFLRGDGVVTEPHSFDVMVTATYDGEQHRWKYDSYEGRTTITAEGAENAGIKVETAGPADIGETVELNGTVELDPGAQSEVGARFPGRVMSVAANVGDQVRAGSLLARVESSESLQTYSVTSPRGGIVLERRTNVGDVTGSDPIFIIADPANVYAALKVFPTQMEYVSRGQSVTVESLNAFRKQQTAIRDFLPIASSASQTLTARAPLPNREGFWHAGMAVRGIVTVSEERVPLAVRTEALQAFRDFTVVFAKVDDTYEVRMLELGRQTSEWTEVLSGLKPGQPYVSEGSFVIKADIEKSGASHDH